MPTPEEITRNWDGLADENPWVIGRPLPESIEIAPYDTNWPATFDRVAAGIRDALGPVALKVEHVGSTSVPGLAAKPVIDVDLTVASSADEPSYVPALERIGYVLFVREPNWHQHRLLRGESPRVNLHVFSPDSPELVRHILFRDWLRVNPDDRQLYEATKLESSRGLIATPDYNLRKEPVIREIYDRVFRAAGLLSEKSSD